MLPQFMTGTLTKTGIRRVHSRSSHSLHQSQNPYRKNSTVKTESCDCNSPSPNFLFTSVKNNFLSFVSLQMLTMAAHTIATLSLSQVNPFSLKENLVDFLFAVAHCLVQKEAVALFKKKQECEEYLLFSSVTGFTVILTDKISK